MPVIVKTDPEHWTYGAEHELADWDSRVGLPKGFARANDWTLVNTNGIAVEPRAKFYPYGGEINTPPTDSPKGQVRALEAVLEHHLTSEVNYRSNLHVHVRVPGLQNSLRLLKRVQEYIHKELPMVLPQIEPIPEGLCLGSKKRQRRRKVSHQTLLTGHRLSKQMSAKTPQEFFELEVPRSKRGQIMWHAQPRLAVNLRQLLQTDTIEFRHFPGTLDGNELLTCVEWCRDFLVSCFNSNSIMPTYRGYRHRKFPTFPVYQFQTEIRYQATCYHGALKAEEIHRNISLILKGSFDGTRAQKEATKRACGLSR